MSQPPRSIKCEQALATWVTFRIVPLMLIMLMLELSQVL